MLQKKCLRETVEALVPLTLLALTHAEVRKCEDDKGDKDDIDAFSQSDAKTVATTSLHSEALGVRIAP